MHGLQATDNNFLILDAMSSEAIKYSCFTAPAT